MSNTTDYLLRVRAPAGADDPQGIRRLRAALKRLGRGYGLRVVEVRPAADANQNGGEHDEH